MTQAKLDQSVSEKTKLSQILSIGLLAAGAVLFFAAAFMLGKNFLVPKKTIVTPSAKALSFQTAITAAQKKPTDLYIKVSPGTDIQALVTKALGTNGRIRVLSSMQAPVIVGANPARDPSAVIIDTPISTGTSLIANTTPVFSQIAVDQKSLTKIHSRAATFDATAVAASIGLTSWQRVSFTQPIDTSLLAKTVQTMPGVLAAEPATTFTLAANAIHDDGSGGATKCSNPNDPYSCLSNTWGNTYQDQWGLDAVHARDAWKTTTGSSTTIVAIVDTGIDTAHPDLQGSLWTGDNGIHGWSMIDNTSDITDQVGHGTHLAGIIGAQTNNGAGMAGVNWHVQLMGVKVFGNGAQDDDSVLANGIMYAANHGADVINMSWGGQGSSAVISDAIAYADQAGVVQVVAAGNSAQDAKLYFPANDPHVITVAAEGPGNVPAYFTNIGDRIDVTAPGVDVLSLRGANTDMYGDGTHIINSDYYLASGTSMATPFVAGVAALIRSQVPHMKPSLVRTAIDASAADIGAVGKDKYNGFGLINAAAAITTAKSYITTPKSELSITNLQASLPKGSTDVAVHFTVNNTGVVASPSTAAYTILGQETHTLYYTGTLPAVGVDNSVVVTHAIHAPSLTDATYVVTVNSSQLPAPEYFFGDNLAKTSVQYLMPGWPQYFSDSSGQMTVANPTNSGAKIIAGSIWHTASVYNANGTVAAGWPKGSEDIYNPEYLNYGPPSLVDVNNDKQLEILFPTWNGQIVAYRENGQAVGGKWPVSSGPGTEFLNALATGDIDGDSKPEILGVGTWFSQDTHTFQGMVSAFHADGTPVGGKWPIKLPVESPNIYTQFNIVAVGDINGDKRDEVVAVGITSNMTDLSDQEEVFAWNADGTEIFHRTLGDMLGSLTLSDLNQDGKTDIIVTAWDGDVYAMDGTGQDLPGWPAQVSPGLFMTGATVAPLDASGHPSLVVTGCTTSGCELDSLSAQGIKKNTSPLLSAPTFLGNTVFADFTGDGIPELVSTDADGHIFILKADGTPLAGWPTTAISNYAYDSIYTPAVADIDSDGKPEIVSVSQDGNIYAWYIPGAVVGSSCPWPTDNGNAQRTNEYSTVPHCLAPATTAGGGSRTPAPKAAP